MRELWQLDPEVYKALNSGSPISANIFTKVLRGGAATLRTTATGTSLEFPIMNFFRDTFFAGLVSPDGFIPIASSIKGTMLYLSNDETYKDFMRAGGGLSTNVEVALHQMGKSNNPLKEDPCNERLAGPHLPVQGFRDGHQGGLLQRGAQGWENPKDSGAGSEGLAQFFPVGRGNGGGGQIRAVLE